MYVSVKYLKNALLSASIASFVALSSGCGFHLKGQGGVSAQQQMLATEFWQAHALILNMSSSNQGFATELKQQLENNNIRLLDAGDAQLNSWVLNLPAAQVRTTQIAQTSLGSTTAEMLRWQQFYQILDADGKLISSGVVQTSRERQVNPNALLAGDTERNEILQSMAQELAVQMVQRLNAVAAANLQQNQLSIESGSAK